MQLYYGSTPFPVDGVEVTTSTRALLTNGDVPYAYETILNGRLQLIADGSQALSALQLQAERTFGQVGRDFILLDDNNQLTSVRLLSAPAQLPGVVVTGFQFPEGKLGNLVTGRDCAFSARATYPTATAVGAILQYSEKIDIIGNGGPRIAYQEATNGPVVPVRLTPQTVTTVVQTGQAIGYLVYPTPALPVLPLQYLMNPETAISRTAPKGNGTEYGVSWRYIFRFPGPLGRTLFPTVYIG